MIANIDRDLSCVYCGKVVYLHLGRDNDYSRRSKRTDNKKQTDGDVVDGASKNAGRNIRSQGSPINGSKMVRQRGLFRQT